MKKILIAGLLAATGTVSAPAFAATTIDLTQGGSQFFGNRIMNGGAFTDTFTILLSNSNVTASVITIALNGNNKLGDIDFSSITLAGIPFIQTRNDMSGNPLEGVSESYVLRPPVDFTSGSYDLVLKGFAYGDSSYAGTINAAVTAAVPEPATWAMMLVGFGAVGYAMRRRKSKVTTRVQFA